MTFIVIRPRDTLFVRNLVLMFTRRFQRQLFLCFRTLSWTESIIMILKSRKFSTSDSTSLLKKCRPVDRHFFVIKGNEDKCFFLSTCRLLNPCLHNSSTCLVTKILSGLLLSVTLSLFTLTQLSYFLSPGQVIVHVHCLWHIPNSRQEQCGCRAGGLKLNAENVRIRGVGLLVLLAVPHDVQSLLRTSVARARVFKMCCIVMRLYWQENCVSDFNL